MNEINPLDALLGASLNEEKPVFIKRLNANFTVRGIDNDAFSEAQAEATTYKAGKGGKQEKVVDESKLNRALIVAGCVSPNFADKQLLEKYGAKTAGEVVAKSLYVGEMASIVSAIMEISGFNTDVEEVKN